MKTVIQSLLLYVAVVNALDVVPVPNGVSGTATTTRYNDCCKLSCAWPDKAAFASALRTVRADGSSADPNEQSICAGGTSAADPAQSPRAIDDQTALGFVATGQLNGQGERELCCACLELTFAASTVLAGKRMLVQITNTGGDLGSNHIDIQVPGGGAGIFTGGCPAQYGGTFNYGAQYGGIQSIEQCAQLPVPQQAGCRFRFEWFKNADNPAVSFKQIACPVELVNISGCRRSDDNAAAAPPSNNKPTMPAAEKPNPNPNLNPNPNRNPSPSSETSCSNHEWQQCGGKLFAGEICCPTGTSCTAVNEYYAQCLFDTHPLNGCPITQRYAQCDGTGYKGRTCCPTGTKCTYVNTYYSQCQ